jgi:hypothetical protein
MPAFLKSLAPGKLSAGKGHRVRGRDGKSFVQPENVSHYDTITIDVIGVIVALIETNDHFATH